MQNIKSASQGFTTVEMLVVFGILSLMLLFVVPVLSYSRKAQQTMQRLDSYHDIRRIDQEIASEIKFGTSIVFPPRPSTSEYSVAASEWAHQAIFRNDLNQIMVIFVDENARLIMLNYDSIDGRRIAPGRILANNVKDFSVRRHGNSVLEYRLGFEGGLQHDFTVSNKITMLNVF